MAEFNVTFLEYPQIGRTTRILYNGQPGDSAILTQVLQISGNPLTIRASDVNGNSLVGYVQQSTQIVGNKPLNSKSMAWKIPIFGCTGLLLLLLLFAAIGSSSISENSASSNSATSKESIAVDDVTVIDFNLTSDGIVGNAKNNSNETKSYVQVEFNLYDSSGRQVGSTFANVNNLEPGRVWSFKAYVLEDNVSSAKLKGVTSY